ncbi:MAG: outer membrane beta-barrel protein [bacterium]
MKCSRALMRVLLMCLLSLLLRVQDGRCQDAAGKDFARPGLYFGVGLAYSVQQFPDEDFDFGNELEVDDSMGFDARLGYRISRYVSLEIEALYNFGFDFHAYHTDLGSIDSYSVTGNAKIYPFAGRFQPYGIVGIGYSGANIEEEYWSDSSESFSDFGVRFGGGVDLYFTRNVLGWFEISYFLGGFDDLEDFDFIPIVFGMQIRI